VLVHFRVQSSPCDSRGSFDGKFALVAIYMSTTTIINALFVEGLHGAQFGGDHMYLKSGDSSAYP
jgi:hypothetical protein